MCCCLHRETSKLDAKYVTIMVASVCDGERLFLFCVVAVTIVLSAISVGIVIH